MFLGSLLGSKKSGNDRFDDPASLIVQKMDLIKNDQMDVLQNTSALSGCYIPLFGGCYQNICRCKFPLGKLDITS